VCFILQTYLGWCNTLVGLLSILEHKNVTHEYLLKCLNVKLCLKKLDAFVEVFVFISSCLLFVNCRNVLRSSASLNRKLTYLTFLVELFMSSQMVST